jgi:hypothetical protein
MIEAAISFLGMVSWAVSVHSWEEITGLSRSIRREMNDD